MINIIKLLHKIQIDNDFIENVIKNNEYNEKVISYYERLQKEDNLQLDNKLESLRDCNKLWLLDKYKKQKIKDFKRTNLCKDKFCNNCKKVKQASRMSNFTPHLDKLEKDFDLFHVVLTIPNVVVHDPNDLKESISNMFSSFRSLNRFLNHTKKIKDLDFYEFGYVGALRSLEVSFNKEDYHPHLHCIFIMKKGLKLNRKFLNKYSFDKFGNKKIRKFSYFEILIQKIWYLLINNKKVTLKNIEDLEEGYSCLVDKIEENHYFEVFKYMTKSNNEKGEFLTYENFRTLYYALKHFRQIQGYGLLYRIKDIDMESIVEEEYNKLIEELNKIESPLEVFEAPKDTLNDNEYLVISRKKIYSYLKTL